MIQEIYLVAFVTLQLTAIYIGRLLRSSKIEFCCSPSISEGVFVVCHVVSRDLFWLPCSSKKIFVYLCSSWISWRFAIDWPKKLFRQSILQWKIQWLVEDFVSMKLRWQENFSRKVTERSRKLFWIPKNIMFMKIRRTSSKKLSNRHRSFQWNHKDRLVTPAKYELIGRKVSLDGKLEVLRNCFDLWRG